MINKVLHNLPELYLILAVLFYWFSTANILNPIAIVLLLVLIFQLVFKKQYLGITIATLFSIANLYLILALISELKEFQEMTPDFIKLIVVGSLFITCNLIAGAFLFKKNITIHKESTV